MLTRKAQSTAEYAITIGIVVAVVAGVMSVALKGGMRKKATQATDLLKNSGTATVSDTSGIGSDVVCNVVTPYAINDRTPTRATERHQRGRMSRSLATVPTLSTTYG